MGLFSYTKSKTGNGTITETRSKNNKTGQVKVSKSYTNSSSKTRKSVSNTGKTKTTKLW